MKPKTLPDLAYQIVEPKTPEYRHLIATAITTGDKETLSALRGNTGKTIHVVDNWFYYGLVVSSHQTAETKTDAVVIYTHSAGSQMVKAFEQIG